MDIQIKKIIEELCVDLKAELDERHANRHHYPLIMGKYKADMDVIRRAKDILEKYKVKSSSRYFIFYYTANNPAGNGYIFIRTEDSSFPNFTSVIKLALEGITKSLGYQSCAAIAITGFNELKSEEDYLAVTGE
jgi:hypothetical protein